MQAYMALEFACGEEQSFSAHICAVSFTVNRNGHLIESVKN